MNEDRGAEAGADVGRTSGKITELAMEGEGKPGSQIRVQPVHSCIRLPHREAAVQALEAEVVLLVDHGAEPVLYQEGRAVAHPRHALQTGQFPAHQVTLVQDPAIGLVHPVQPEGCRLGQRAGLARRRRHQPQDPLPVGVAVAAAEGITGEVSGQPDPGRKHQVAVGSAGVEPPHAAVSKQAEVDHSSTLSRSRSSAASSKFSEATASFSFSRNSRSSWAVGISPVSWAYRSPT